MNTKKILKVAGAIGAGALLIAGGALGTGIVKNDTIQEQAAQISQLQLNEKSLNSTIVDLKNAEPVIEYVDKEVLVNNTVEVEVEVDNGNLDLVLDHIYDNKGDVSYLTEDLDDDEVNEIVDRLIFVNEIKVLAAEEAKSEIKDLLDKEEFTFNNVTVKFDEDDIERVRVQDDDDEVIVGEDIDFEDGDADVEAEVKFEQDSIKYVANVIVEFRDGSVDDIELSDVKLRD